MRVNNALYYGQMQNNYNAALHRQQKLQRINKAQAGIYKRMRDNPDQHDIENGDALNVQLDLLLNPKIYSAVLQSVRTPISKDMIKEIPFEYASEGVTVCLNELTLNENLPPALREDVYKPYIAISRRSMQVALDEDVKGDLKPSTINKAADSLAKLQAAFEKNVPNTDPDYYTTADFLKGMAGMVRMLHRPDVEEAIAGLEKGPSTNLGELLGFMHAYSLRFGPAQTAEQKRIYQDLYPILVSVPKSLPQPVARADGSVVADTANTVENGAVNASKELGNAAASFFKPADPSSFARRLPLTAVIRSCFAGSARRILRESDHASQRSYQSWNIRSVQSGLRWSRTPARCSRDPAGDLVGRNRPCRSQPVAARAGRSSKRASGPRSQRATGMPKPFLGRSRIDAGQPTRDRRLEQPLGPPPAVLESRRQPLDRVDQLGVEERRPDLQAAGHARPVDLGQDVLGQVGVLIERQRPGRGVGARGQTPAARRGARPRRRASPGSTSSAAISAPENEPSQRWWASGAARPAPRRNCLSLKSKLKLR